MLIEGDLECEDKLVCEEQQPSKWSEVVSEQAARIRAKSALPMPRVTLVGRRGRSGWCMYEEASDRVPKQGVVGYRYASSDTVSQFMRNMRVDRGNGAVGAAATNVAERGV